MIIKKITVGWVVQTFDTDNGQLVEQCFHASDQVDYENEQGESIDATEDHDPNYRMIEDLYYPFDMIQARYDNYDDDDLFLTFGPM